MIKAFPKIFAIGTDYIKNIFDNPVEVTEKVDGSQFSFGKVYGRVYCRSKGASLYFENKEQMFSEALSYVESISGLLPEQQVFYCEYLKKPKHNTLKYNRIPKNHLVLFGVMDFNKQSFKPTKELPGWAGRVGIECVPVLEQDVIISDVEKLTELLNRESILGGPKIEGIVVKNYYQKFLIGGQPMPIMAGKFVSEKFKEVHQKQWKENSGKSKIETFFGFYRTEARWEKAAQYLRDCGQLENSPKDIGNLFKRVHQDIEKEEKEVVKEFLWNEYKNELKRKATSGLAEWYKEKLIKRSFEGE